MTRGHPAPFLDAAQAALVNPVWLVAIWTGLTAPNDVLRFASAARDVVFPDGGDTYAARPIGQGVIDVNSESPGSMTLALGDDGTIRGLAASWHDKKVRLIRIERSVTAQADYCQIDEYLIDAAIPATGVFTFQLSQRRSRLETQIPLVLVNFEEFPGIPANS